MARLSERLSAKRVELVAKAGMYADGHGLYLRVGPTGAKSWVFRYRNNHQRHDLGLGPYHLVSLAEARKRAAEQRRLLRLDGQDPLLTRRAGRDQAKLAAAKAMSFKACAEAYMAAHQAGWRNPKHRTQWAATLNTYVYPAFGDLPVQAIDVSLVMKALEPIWTEKTETASRVRGRIEAVLDWATARGYREGENPARWRGHLQNLLPLLRASGVPMPGAPPCRCASNGSRSRRSSSAAVPYRTLLRRSPQSTASEAFTMADGPPSSVIQ